MKALRGVNLDVQRGEFLAVTGPSGSGKSTFMHIVGCLDRPTSGQYLLDGEDVSRMSKDELAAVRNKKIGFVFQGFNLLSRTSALDNVELPLLYGGSGLKTAERHKRAMDVLTRSGSASASITIPNQLSGGQQQRVAIARALINNPSILLADEPTGNLDTRTSIEVMDIFQRLNIERGITVVLITHELDIAEYGTRIVTFRDGQVVADRAGRTAPATARRTRLDERCRSRPRRVMTPCHLMIFRIALKALGRNKMRTALTMLGMIIGVAAVITMVALGTGAQSSIEAQIQSAGTNMIMVSAGNFTQGGVRQGQGNASTLTPDDAQGDRRGAGRPVHGRRREHARPGRRRQPELEHADPGHRRRPAAHPRLADDPGRDSSRRPTSPRRRRWPCSARSSATSCSAPDVNPVGQMIRINNQPFTVVGVMPSKGQSGMGQDQDDVVSTCRTRR